MNQPGKTYYPPSNTTNLEYYPYKNYFILPENGSYRVVKPDYSKTTELTKSIWQAHRIIDKLIREK